MSDPDDDALMMRLRNGDAAAIDDISRRYGSELRLFCRRMLFNEASAEDIVQDVLLTCCRVEAAQVPSGSLRGWLYRVARNRCIDSLRRMHPNVRLSAVQSAHANGPALLAVDPSTTPAGRALKLDQAAQIHAIVTGMDDNLREVVIMHFFQGLSTSEIADALELSHSGAKARLARATRFLRQRLSALNDSSA